MACPSPPVIPELCLICYDNLTPEELKRRSAADPEQIQGTFSNDAIFILRTLLQVPDHLLEGFCVNVEDKIPPGLWISVCNRCSGAVEEAKLVYHQILKLCAKFRDARREMVQKVRESCGGGGGGKRGRSLRKKGDDDFLKRIAVTEECRKFVNERTFDPVTEEAFVVEDVAVWTSGFLARLELLSAEVPETVIIKPDYQEEEVGGEETLINLDPLAFSQNEDDPMMMDEKDPLSFPEDDNPSSEDIEFKEEADKIKSEQSSDDLQEDDSAKAISERLVLGDSKNECPTCHKNFSTVAGLKRHLLVAHHVRIVKEPKVNTTKKCPEPGCDLTFTDRHDFRRHLVSHRKGEPQFKCDICGRAFHSKRTGLASHLLKVHGIATPTKRSVECPICHSKHASGAALRHHIHKLHKNQALEAISQLDKFPCTWKECGKIFGTKQRLEVHLSRHEGRPGCKCDTCGEAFYCPQELSRHRDATHSGRTFGCDFCDKTFPTRQQMQSHRSAVHERKAGKVGCQNRKQAETSPKITAPEGRKSKVGSKSLQCHICGKSYPTPQKVREHVKFIHEEDYGLRCDLCGKGLRHPFQLKVHMAQSHRIPEPSSGQIWQCPVTGCRRVFPGQRELEVHSAKDHGETGMETRFQCTHCGKGFHQKYKLSQHEMSHTNRESRPFKCDLCGKGFSNQHNLRYHQRNTHKVERLVKRRRKEEIKPTKNREEKKAGDTEMPQLSRENTTADHNKQNETQPV